MLWNDVLFASLLAAAPLDPSITVTGRGTAEASPDQARITVAVETEAETARKALDANNQRAAQLVAALEELKIPRRMIQTSQLSLHPVYGTEATPRITGYRAFNQVVVETHRIDALGTILDALVQRGANRIDQLTFGVRDPSRLSSQARRSAMANALRSAEHLASLAGVKLGQVISIREAPALEGPQPLAMEASRSAVPIEPGAYELEYEVIVTYAIERREPGA